MGGAFETPVAPRAWHAALCSRSPCKGLAADGCTSLPFYEGNSVLSAEEESISNTRVSPLWLL